MNIAVVVVAKNERFISDFVQHYLNLGVNKIFLGDNGLTQDQLDDLRFYISSEFVEVIDCHGRKYFQESFYNEIINNNKLDYDWFIVVDADELLFINDNIKNYLSEFSNKYPDVGSIGFNWLMYGSLKYKIYRLTECSPYFSDYDSKYGKIIVRSTAVNIVDTPHTCILKDNYHRYLSNGELLISDEPCYKVCDYKVGHIAHYYSKSKYDWDIKMQNGFPNSDGSRDLQEYQLQYSHLSRWLMYFLDEVGYYSNTSKCDGLLLEKYTDSDINNLIMNLLTYRNKSFNYQSDNISAFNVLYCLSLITNNKLIRL